MIQFQPYTQKSRVNLESKLVDSDLIDRWVVRNEGKSLIHLENIALEMPVCPDCLTHLWKPLISRGER
jgi:hypothetical protein